MCCRYVKTFYFFIEFFVFILDISEDDKIEIYIYNNIPLLALFFNNQGIIFKIKKSLFTKICNKKFMVTQDVNIIQQTYQSTPNKLNCGKAWMGWFHDKESGSS